MNDSPVSKLLVLLYLPWLASLLLASSAIAAEDTEASSEEQITKTVEVEIVTETLTMPLSDKRMHGNVDLPKRGTSEQNVLNEYGEPTQSFPARGTPPISRWVYPAFTVYFESGWVIHSVVKVKQ